MNSTILTINRFKLLLGKEIGELEEREDIGTD